MIIDKSIKVEKSADQLSKVMVGIVSAIIAGKKDNLSATQIVEKVGIELLNVVSIVGDLSNLSADFKENEVLFIKSFALGAFDIADVLVD